MVIHETASVAPDTKFGDNFTVGPMAIIGQDREERGPVVFGDDCLVRSHAIVYAGSTFGDRCALGHYSLVREGCVIGADVSIGSRTGLAPGVQVGDGVRFHSGCFIGEQSVIEDDAWFGPNVMVINARYPNRPDTKGNLEGVLVERGAVIGAGVLLLPGVRIGAGALIGAGAVVTRDVAPGGKIVGNPGRAIA